MNTPEPERLAGLPTNLPPPTHDARSERLSLEFTLPASVAKTLSWRAADAPLAWLSFRMSELTPQDQSEAVRLAGTANPPLLLQELIYKTLVSVGGEPVRGKRDQLDRWWRALGPKGRKLVEAAFMQISSPSEEELQMFLDSGKP